MTINKDKKMNEKKWSETVKTLRLKLNESQERFAKRLNTTQFTICRWENDKQKPSFMAQKLIEDLATEIDDINKS